MTALLSTNGPPSVSLEAAPLKLLVATTEGAAVLERDRPGSSWHQTGRVLADKHLSTLMRVPGGGIFAGVHRGSLFYSDDDGETWAERADGITIDNVYSLGYREEPGGVALYLGTEPVGLFRSRDLGLHWEELPTIKTVPGHDRWSFPPPPHFAHTKGITFDPRDPDIFYIAIEQGALLKTFDGGKTWTELAGFSHPDDEWYKDVHRVVCMPSNPDELYLLTGVGLYCSYDAGVTWERRTDSSFRIGYPDQLIVSPADDRVMLMSGAFAPPLSWRKKSEALGWVMRTRDGGRTWEDANDGLPVMSKSNIEAITAACYPGGYEVFAGNTDGEIYSTDNDGDSWTRIADDVSPVSKGGHHRVLQALTGF